MWKKKLALIDTDGQFYVCIVSWKFAQIYIFKNYSKKSTKIVSYYSAL